MGCGASKNNAKKDSKYVPEERDLKLCSCRVTFTDRHLFKLNRKFSNLLECNLNTRRENDHKTASLGVVVERLIQRLICNVGNMDPRFSSKFLINLKPLKTHSCESRKGLRYKYLVRLDLLSTPALYPDYFEPPVSIIEGIDNESLPQGYAKVRVHGEFLEQWLGFIGPSGFIRRDKIQERFVELLARAAARPSEPFCPKDVDESRQCGSPGKVVDPITLHQILRKPPREQVFFGSAECNESRFPDPRDFRIAIVEGVPETRLHISFLSPSAQSITAEEEVEISITLGIGVTGWPLNSDFPTRLSLDHVDFILSYQAAQLDYYLVPRGPNSSIYCEDRSSVWEIRTFATEMFLEHHYSPNSVVFRIYKTLVFLLEILKARGVKTINRYILKTLLFFELEHRKEIHQWTPNMISRRVLSILDRLLICLRNQMLPSYVFAGKNLLLQDDALEDDYISDGDILENYLRQLHNDGSKAEQDDGEFTTIKDQMENVMLQKWQNVITNMLPPISNRSRRLSVVNNSPASISYTRQQMEYVAVLIREILKLKSIQRRRTIREIAKDKVIDGSSEMTKNKDDFVYLLQVMFDQAKQKLITSTVSRTHFRRTAAEKTLKLNQVIQSYDISTAMLIDDIKRSKKMECNFEDDMSIVVKIMESLYKAIDSDGRVLGPVLRPYLNQIFRGSHENCWFLFEWKKKTDLSEFSAIGAFAKLVTEGSIDPLDGILNSAAKGWDWASRCLEIMQTITEEHSTRIIIGDKIEANESGLRLIFAPQPGKTIRLNVSTTKPGWMRCLNGQTTNRNGNVGERTETDGRYATIRSFQNVLDLAITSGEAPEYYKQREIMLGKGLKGRRDRKPSHAELRDGNPFTVASTQARRQGNHRGLGSIVQALISLRKLTILQEISEYLPENDRTKVLSDIKKLSKEVQRLSITNYRMKRSFSLPKNRFSFKKSTKTLPPRTTLPRRISEALPTAPKPEKPAREIYRSVNEFSVLEREELQKEIKLRERELDEELRKAKEESLLGTCRQLRRQYRPTVFESNTFAHSALPKAGRYNRGSSTLPKSINTPFYIKVSSYGSKHSQETTEV